MRQSKKTWGILWSTWIFCELLDKRRPSKYCLWEVNLFFYIYIVSLICQIVNLLWKIAVQNDGCAFAYFCGGHKNIFGYNFVAPLNQKVEEKY